MSSKPEHMFPDRELTEKEISDYRAGRLSPEEMNRIERIAASNPMSATALEGFRGMAHPDIVADIKKSVSTRSGLLLGTWTKFAALGGIAIVVAFMVYKNQQTPEAAAIPITDHKQIDEPVADTEPLADAHMLVVNQRSTDSSVSVVMSMPQEVTSVEEPFVHYQEIPDPEALNPITFELLAEYEFNDEPVDDEPSLATPSQRARIYHIRDYKLVDYRGLREEPFSVLKHDLTGLPAKYADETDRNDDLPEIVPVPYVDYLEGAMVEFSQENFISAAKRFDKILKAYPDDANALFYGGMARYYSGRDKKAIQFFEKALDGEILTFSQEAEFYMAKSLRSCGKRNEARIIFQRIAEEGGFYADQAGEYVE